MNLNSYRTSPDHAIGILELWEICLERLELYKLLEIAKLENIEIGSEEWSDFLKLRINKSNLRTYWDLLSVENACMIEKSRKYDNTAHWILGICYCRTEELQKYYVQWELEWFHLIYMNSSKEIKESFKKFNKIRYPKLKVQDKIIMEDELRDCISGCDILNDTIYKVYFSEVLELLKTRQVCLKNGWTYVTENSLIHCIKRKFKHEFLGCLSFQQKVLPTIDDDRIHQLIRDIPVFVPRKNSIYNLDGIHLENIDDISENHYPPCMRHLHNVLRTQNHLKYFSRMQYGIFLYYVGLPYEQALELWKEEFTKKISEKDYKSKYEYLFKHQYGKVGRKRPYQVMECSKILNASHLEQNGCPFKHWGKDQLRKLLLEDDGLTLNEMVDIEDLAGKGHFQKACTTYFCAKNDVNLQDIIVSPMQYVAESMKTCENFI